MGTRRDVVRAEDGTVLTAPGVGEGEALVLVHGAASDARQWARVVPLLAASLTVVAMERRGRGGSGPIRAGHSLAVEHGDIASVVRSLPGPVHLLGHSSGARFALDAARQLPDLASLILYEPPAPERFTAAALEALDRLEAAGDRLGILRLFLLDVLDNDEESFDHLQRRPIWPIMLDNALTLPAELRATRHHRFDPSAFAGLAVPTLLMVGEQSG
ncbi:MAG: alpha/beta fold hydrolase, partial [Acidimicrobiales bacterium]